MTAPLRGMPHSQLPASQTAPVAEFRCLYTPDVRKKQKKWQDGFLKFHSFNNRVMVYDQARNFLGDTYYKDSDALHEGDELTLDKGVMVEVADALGVTQTDLKPLFEKKPREALPPPSAPPRRFQPPSQVARPQPAPSSNAARATSQQPRHKSLNTLLGTPKGPIGKSVPIKSPYDARQEKEKEKENDFPVDRAAKRQKTANNSTSSATLQLSSPAPAISPAPKESELPRTKSAAARTIRKPATPLPPDTPVITLDELDDVAHVSSPPSLPSTPPAVFETASRPVVTPAQPVRPAVAAKPTKQTPRLPRGKVPVPSVKALETPRAPALPSSPPVSASNRLTNIDFAMQPTPVKAPIARPSKQPSAPPADEHSVSPPRNPKAKSLRLSRGVKRGTLMICQPPPALPRSREPSEAQSKTRDSIPTLSVMNAAKGTSTGLKAPISKRKAVVEDIEGGKRARWRAEDSLDDFDDDPELVHGLMDQQLLVSGTPPPEPILVPDSPEEVMFRSRTPTTIVQSARLPGSHNVKPYSVTATSPPVQVSTGARSKATTTAAADDDFVASVVAPATAALVAKKKSGLAALIKKTDPQRKFVRTQSLTVETAIPPAREIESPMVSPVVDKDIGPWSTEAFDLFDWRPPGREELGT